MIHDEFAQHEDDTRDLVEALGKLSRARQASPGFTARVMAQADEMPSPRRNPLFWLQSLPLWPTSPGLQVAVATFALVLMVGAVSQYVTWVRAGLLGIPSGAIREAQLQESLWQKNFDCATRLNQHSANYGAISGDEVSVVTWACPSGDVLVTLESLADSDDVIRRSVWVALEASQKTVSFFDGWVPMAFAASNPVQLAKQSNPVTGVVCQKRLPGKMVKRRVKRANGKCEDEWIKTTNGSVVKRKAAPCDATC